MTSSVSKFLIPNVIDDDIFYPVLKKEARDFFNLNMDTIYVGFGSMNFSIDKNKGFHLFLDSIKYLKYDITFLFFGTEINLSDLCESINYINVGYINDDKSLNFLYNSMDILVVPSLFENLSCTIMESLSSSTPVVAFDTGGNSDLIIHQYNGYLAQPFESLDLANGINWILEVEDFNKLKSNSREHILKNFSKETVLDSHLKLYNKILSC